MPSSRGHAVAQRVHVAELPGGVDVQQREGRRRRVEGLRARCSITALSLPMEYSITGVGLGHHLAQDVDALGLQALQVGQFGVRKTVPVGVGQLDQAAGDRIDQPGERARRDGVGQGRPAGICADRRPGLHRLEQVHHRIGPQKTIVQHPAVRPQQAGGPHRLAGADRLGLATRAAEGQQGEGLLIGVGALVQGGAVDVGQDAIQAVAPGEGGGQGGQGMIAGPRPRAGPAEPAGLGVDPGLARRDPGPARAFDGLAVLADLLEAAALFAIEPDLPPQGQGVIEQPALQLRVEGENVFGGPIFSPLIPAKAGTQVF
jgi:hypothetical protein